VELDFDVPSLLGRHIQLYHVGIACHDLEKAMALVGDLFDVSWTAIADDTLPGLFTPDGPSDWSARRVHSIGSPVPFELLEGTPGSTWDTDKTVVTHHLAYWSPDIPGDVRTLESEGWSVEIDMLDADGIPTTFAYMVKPGAVRIELVDVSRRPDYLARTGQG
jgi:hypothetical protein